VINSDFIARNSSYIENLMRHRFIFDISQQMLLRSKEPAVVTVLSAEVDNAGVDLVLSFRQVTRQIQMKTLAKRTTSNPYAVAESLSDLPGGCVVWMCYDPKNFTPTVYHFMGGKGNERMNDLRTFPEASKSKRTGKVPRLGYRSIRLRDATYRGLSLQHLVNLLFALPSP
jgi:hypothetical protein